MLELYAKGSEAAWLRSFSFAQPFRPRFCETDALGHVSNVSYPIYLEFARMAYFERAGDPERESPNHLPFNHNAVEIAMRFLRPCFFDEPLRIHTRLASLGRSSGMLEYAITPDPGDELRTIARVAIVCMRGERSAPWSDAQRAVLEGLLP